MKFAKYLTLSFLFAFLCGYTFVLAERLNTERVNSEEYLRNHGHSPEVIRMIKMQEVRTVGEKKVKESNRIVKFLKNIYYERNLTMPLEDFGQQDIISPEAPPHDSAPRKINRKLFNRE